MIEKPQVEPLLWRTFDAEQVGAVMNHADVRPHIGPGPEVIDPAGFLADPRNIALFNEHGGFLFHCHAPGVYEVHTQFLKSGRGRQALEAAKYAAFVMFTRSDCMEITTKIQADNKRAIWLTEAMGFEFLFEAEQEGWGLMRYYVLGYPKWASSSPYLPLIGEWFCREVGVAASQARPLGAAIEMFQAGYLGKGVHLYRRWARLTGAPSLEVVSADPFSFSVNDRAFIVRDGEFSVR